MSAQPIDDGGPVYPWTRQIRCGGALIDTENVPGQSYRADVAKLCLAALCSDPQGLRSMHSQAKYDAMAEEALKHADALIRRLKGGPR